MKTFKGIFALLAVLGLLAPVNAMAEEAISGDSGSTAVQDELAAVKTAWEWASTADPALAGKLEAIVAGDRSEAAVATLHEAATATATANPDLSAQLMALATAWTPQA